MININIMIDGNEVTINQSGKTTKVSKHTAKHKVNKPKKMYAVMYDYDEQTFLHSMHTSATEANKALIKCQLDNHQYYGNNTSEYIMVQSDGKLKKLLTAFDWEEFDQKGSDWDIDE